MPGSPGLVGRAAPAPLSRKRNGVIRTWLWQEEKRELARSDSTANAGTSTVQRASRGQLSGRDSHLVTPGKQCSPVSLQGTAQG